MADYISKAAEPKGAGSDGTGPLGQISDPEHDNDDVENPNRPKGFSFAIVYTCILFGDFFTGYVSLPILDSNKPMLTLLGFKLCWGFDACNHR